MLYMMLLILSFFTLAESDDLFVYQLKGEYPTRDGNVNYVLRWSEEENHLFGTYTDDKTKNEKSIEGIVKSNERVFIVPKKFVIETEKKEARRFGQNVETKIKIDEKNKFKTIKSKARFSATAAKIQKEEEESCVVGFGALATYCGRYRGLVTEEVDRQNRCNLLSKGELEVEVLPSRDVVINFISTRDTKNSGQHRVGKVPLDSASASIDITGRDCRVLSGILPPSTKCKRLNLEGEFTTTGGKQSFQGRYIIFDEATMNTCTYSLSLERMEALEESAIITWHP